VDAELGNDGAGVDRDAAREALPLGVAFLVAAWPAITLDPLLFRLVAPLEAPVGAGHTADAAALLTRSTSVAMLCIVSHAID
jgi:hypothetical protein